MDQELIDDTASSLEEDLIALRRDIHAHPEGPGNESRTAAAVAELLDEADLTVTTGVGGHGVVGVLEGECPGRTVAYRADMDAVPVAGQIGGGDAPAHLCGHDLHTTVGVGVAQTLAQLRGRLRGTVAFLFQPAEETLTGARAMIDDGVLDQTTPDEIHALHCGPFPVGEFAVTPGTGLPGQDRGVLTVTGADAVERAEQLAAEVRALATVLPPQTPEDLEQLVADLQTPDSPLSRFVFLQARVGGTDTAERAEVEVSYRCWPEERYGDIREEIGRIASSHGEVQVSFPPEPFPAMICPEKDGRAVERHLRRAIGRDSATVLHAAVPFSGEDFALFLDRLPGSFTYLGVRAPEAEVATSYPHFGGFDPDERAIGFGVRAMAGWLAERARRGR
nr:amidohydrolase [Glycomyces xiaoerkulensis]